MNTPAHLLLGMAAFSKAGKRRITAGAAVGALLPDLSLYVLAGISLVVLRIPPDRVFGELYYSDLWQTVFAIDNSFVIWAALLGVALWRRVDWAIALCGAALLHIGLDFPLHHDDGRPHFWPLSNWVFESPVSYWDTRRYAGWVAPVAGLVALLCAFVLWRRHANWGLRAGVIVLLGLEMWTIRSWLLFF